jgi:hypothetical protein
MAGFGNGVTAAAAPAAAPVRIARRLGLYQSALVFVMMCSVSSCRFLRKHISQNRPCHQQTPICLDNHARPDILRACARRIRIEGALLSVVDCEILKNDLMALAVEFFAPGRCDG